MKSKQWAWVLEAAVEQGVMPATNVAIAPVGAKRYQSTHVRYQWLRHFSHIPKVLNVVFIIIYITYFVGNLCKAEAAVHGCYHSGSRFTLQ